MNDSGNLIEMTDSQISAIKLRAKYLYIKNPSVALSVVGTGGSLGTINDTRLQAGAASTDVSAFPDEATTEEPSIVTVGWDRVSETVAVLTEPVDNGYSYPLYYDAEGNLSSMSLQDMYDTFIFDAMTDAKDEVYYIHSASTLTGWKTVSDTVIFQDTGADVSEYTADGITEVQDQPYTRASFYLMIQDPVAPASDLPVKSDGDNIIEYTISQLDTILEACIRYVAANVAGYKNRYSWNGDGVDRGAAWDDRLNGTGNYVESTTYIDGDDYRAQEFPDGTFVRINTYYLRSRLD
jgi:hypothetical protein